MKKQTKVLVTLSAAALLAVGFSAVSFAEGWDNSTGSWQYLDKDGEPVTDTWKSSNGQWFWLGDDGNMVTDSLIEDTTESKTKYYYVDANGARVSNTWKAVALDGSENTDIDAEYWWYYFGSDGKAYTSDADKELTKNKLKTINGLKYCFDDEGHMLYGWVNATNWDQQDDDDTAWRDSKWYFNGWNDGHAENGWKQLTVTNNDGDEKDYWFYFKNGEKKTGKQKIDGKTYLLDTEDGHMLDEWVELNGSTASDVDANTATPELKYVNGDGAQRKNKWVWAIPDEDYDEEDYNKDEYSWWYYNKSGDLAAQEIKKINGKWYAFDAKGRMQTDFVVADDKAFVGHFAHDDYSREDFLTGLNTALAADKKTFRVNDDLYFYSTDEEKDGSRKTGYQNIELDDDTYQFYFDTKSGKATTGYVKKIKKYTVNGLVLKATDDDNSNYVGIDADYQGDVREGVKLVVTGADTVDKVLVNKSGTAVLNKTKLRDENDNYYVVRDADHGATVAMFFKSEDDYDKFFDAGYYEYNDDNELVKVTAKAIVGSDSLPQTVYTLKKDGSIKATYTLKLVDGTPSLSKQ